MIRTTGPAGLAAFVAALCGPASAQLAERLPEQTIFYAEVAAGDVLAGTRLLELWQEEELQDFLEPALSGIRSDVEYLLRKAPAHLRERAAQVDLLPAQLALIRLEVEDSDLAQLEFAVEVGLGAGAAEAFGHLAELVAEEADELKVERGEVAGRPALTVQDEEESTRFVLDGERLVMQVVVGEDSLPPYSDLFGEGGARLAQGSLFQRVKERAAGAAPVVFAFADMSQARELIARAMTRSAEDGAEADAMRRVFLEQPEFKETLAIGWGVAADGALLRDRWYVHAPGERAGWGSSPQIGDGPTRHAALADPDADLLLTFGFDLGALLSELKVEEQRVHAIFAELKIEQEPDDDNLTVLFNRVREATGIDLEQELAPALGTCVSAFISMPPAPPTVPDLGLIFDLKDGAAIDGLLQRLVDRDDEFDVVNFTREKAGERSLLLVRLVDAGLPIIPTLCRLGDQLLVTLTPQAMKTLLRTIDEGRTLRGQQAVAAFVEQAAPAATGVLWCDMGATFGYLYGFLGLGLSAARMEGLEFSERFDGALLPSGDLLADHLGQGTYHSIEDAEGLVYEGVSTIGNPLLGPVQGILSVVGLIGLSEGLRQATAEQRTDDSRDNLRELARAMEAYRGSVGAGSYPKDLVQLLDRGMLREKERLVDPLDEQPRKVRSANGDRLPVSYAVGTVDALPATVREDLPEGATTVLYTRDPWHPHHGGKARLVIVLGAGDEVHLVPADEWGG